MKINGQIERYSALIAGLETQSSTKANSAVYIISKLNENGSEKYDLDNFEYRQGYNIKSDTLLHSLPIIWEKAESDEIEGYDEEKETGRILQEYDINDIALYLYKDEVDREEMSRGLQKRVESLEKDSERIENQLSEIKKRIKI